MFTTIVAWLSLVIGSVVISVALIDVTFQLTPATRLLGVGAYFSKQMLVVVPVWFVSGWYLFG
jgi:hypothetical protein